MPGFYTDHSWLDIDDRFVVFLENDELIYFGFHKKLIPKVQRAYQDDKTLEELISISKSKKVNRINLQQISELTSRHNSDVIGIKSDDESYSVEFLNQAIKAHALEAIKVRMPTDLDYKLTQKSRIGAAIPATLFLLSIFLIGYYVDALVVQVILGLIGIVWVIPTVFSRLIDPTEIKIWAKQEQPEALATHK